MYAFIHWPSIILGASVVIIGAFVLICIVLFFLKIVGESDCPQCGNLQNKIGVETVNPLHTAVQEEHHVFKCSKCGHEWSLINKKLVCRVYTARPPCPSHFRTSDETLLAREHTNAHRN